MHNSYNQFLFHSFLSALHVSNESSLTARLYRLYCVIQYIMPCCWWWTTRFVRNMQSRQKNCGIKIDYKNCASRWSLTHCNMMHGTYNVKFLTGLCSLSFLMDKWYIKTKKWHQFNSFAFLWIFISQEKPCLVLYGVILLTVNP